MNFHRTIGNSVLKCFTTRAHQLCNIRPSHDNHLTLFPQISVYVTQENLGRMNWGLLETFHNEWLTSACELSAYDCNLSHFACLSLIKRRGQPWVLNVWLRATASFQRTNSCYNFWLKFQTKLQSSMAAGVERNNSAAYTTRFRGYTTHHAFAESVH